MILSLNPELDLTISRLIKAPRRLVWSAWTDPASFEQWWVPAPAKCKVVEMDLRPGGAFVTEISENGGAFAPHLQRLLPRRRRATSGSSSPMRWSADGGLPNSPS